MVWDASVRLYLGGFGAYSHLGADNPEHWRVVAAGTVGRAGVNTHLLYTVKKKFKSGSPID